MKRGRWRPTGGPLAPLCALAIAMISVQFGASYAKRLFPVAGAEGAATLRVVLAAVMLTAILRPWRRPIPLAAMPAIIGYGISLGAMNLLFYMAIQRIPLGLTVALEFTGPLGVSILSARRWRDILWIGLAIGGLCLLLPLHASAHREDPIGLLFALGAGFFWALYILFGRRAGATSGAQAVGAGAIIAALLLVPVGLMYAGAALFTPSIIVPAVIVAATSSALPYSLEMIALARLPARVFSSLMCVEPAVGALMGWSILHEVLSVKALFAVGLIMAASLGTTLTMGPLQETALASNPVADRRGAPD